MTMGRRSALAALLMVGGLQLSGCAVRPRWEPDGRYCYRVHAHPRNRLTCTPGPVPDAAAEERAKRFEAVPARLVVYVVRHHWGDVVNLVNLTIDGGASVATTPASLVRFVAEPGVHRLAFDWKKGRGDLEVRGQAGQVLFVALVGSLWFWDESYRLETSAPSIRDRALKSRLVADLNLEARE